MFDLFFKAVGAFFVEGLHALPNTMFDLFFKAVVTFFVEGHKALPCTDSVRPIF